MNDFSHQQNLSMYSFWRYHRTPNENVLDQNDCFCLIRAISFRANKPWATSYKGFRLAKIK